MLLRGSGGTGSLSAGARCQVKYHLGEHEVLKQYSKRYSQAQRHHGPVKSPRG